MSTSPLGHVFTNPTSLKQAGWEHISSHMVGPQGDTLPALYPNLALPIRSFQPTSDGRLVTLQEYPAEPGETPLLLVSIWQPQRQGART